MSDTRFVNIGEPLNIKFSRLYNNRGVTGLIPLLTIYRDSDDLYWTGTTWGAITPLTMSETSSANSPGLYEYEGPTPTIVETYNCHSYITSGIYAVDLYETLESQTPFTGSTTATWDPNTRVILSAGQPDYAPALEISATANKNEVLVAISATTFEWDPTIRVVLSASQPDYAVVKSTDEMVLTSGTIAEI